MRPASATTSTTCRRSRGARREAAGGRPERGMLFSVSVDLDGLRCHAGIPRLHGPLDDRALRAVPDIAVQRFCELFAALRIPATFFVIGREASIAPDMLRHASGEGHEIGSHSHAHDYALSRRPLAQVAEDLAAAERAIEDACGRKPRGFRAPGYPLSPALVEAVRARGYLYDSSLLPSPPYYAAKAAALALYAIRGKRSRSILGAPGQVFGSRAPHWRSGLRELPIATLPLLRAPVIGTVLAATPPRMGVLLARAAAASGHFNLELHGIDALDGSDGVPAGLVAAQ